MFAIVLVILWGPVQYLFLSCDAVWLLHHPLVLLGYEGIKLKWASSNRRSIQASSHRPAWASYPSPECMNPSCLQKIIISACKLITLTQITRPGLWLVLRRVPIIMEAQQALRALPVCRQGWLSFSVMFAWNFYFWVCYICIGGS